MLFKWCIYSVWHLTIYWKRGGGIKQKLYKKVKYISRTTQVEDTAVNFNSF